jgi:hypothetical protein
MVMKEWRSGVVRRWSVLDWDGRKITYIRLTKLVLQFRHCVVAVPVIQPDATTTVDGDFWAVEWPRAPGRIANLMLADRELARFLLRSMLRRELLEVNGGELVHADEAATNFRLRLWGLGVSVNLCDYQFG